MEIIFHPDWFSDYNSKKLFSLHELENDRMNITDYLAASPLFKGLNSENYKELAGIVIEQDVKRGQFIFNEGDEGVGFYVVASGLVKIYKLS
ncbi:MAG: Crp/Fnr family transcriptional regulator, partial [Desulfobulbaceae bacterium]|nr:Crp/Fnr family transcriptional regulator [Desulfobulbaceae bacterium]